MDDLDGPPLDRSISDQMSSNMSEGPQAPMFKPCESTRFINCLSNKKKDKDQVYCGRAIDGTPLYV